MEPPKLKTGDAVTVRYADDGPLDAVVILASANAQSLALEFEAILGPYAGMMPVLWDGQAGVYKDLFTGTHVVVEGAEGGEP